MILRSNNKLLAIYALLTIILCSGHAFQTVFTRVTNMVIPLAAVVLLFEIANVHNLKVDKLRGAVLIFIIMIGCTLVTSLGAGIVYYVTLMCTIIAAYGVCKWYSFKTVADCYLKIMTVVTIVALVGYTLVQTTTALEVLPSVENINEVEYRVAGIFNYITQVPDRNCGMFWEPGLFATHLTIAMVLEILVQKKTSVWRMLLFSAAIFTANSSAGFVLWFLCLMLMLVKKANAKNMVYGIIALVATVIGLIVILNFDSILKQTGLIENEYFAKLSSDSVEESSRMKAIEHNLKSFLSAPFFGVGVVTAAQQMEHVADTSTSTYLLSVFGILGIAYTVYWVMGVLKIRKMNLLSKIVLLTIIFVVLNKEPHHQLFLSWCLMFYLVKGEFNQDLSENETEKNMPSVQAGGVL